MVVSLCQGAGESIFETTSCGGSVNDPEPPAGAHPVLPTGRLAQARLTRRQQHCRRRRTASRCCENALIDRLLRRSALPSA